MRKSIALPEELYNKAAEFAARVNVSVDEFVSKVLSDQFARSDVIATRAKLFSRVKFERALDTIPDVEPENYYRI
jgi:hypothetical protein